MPGGSTAGFGYDGRGRRTTVTDQDGHTTSYAYDNADRLTSVTDAATDVTQYSYDTENNLLSITDAAGHVTSFTYDAFGRVTQTSFPSGLTETYAGACPRGDPAAAGEPKERGQQSHRQNRSQGPDDPLCL